MLLHWNRSDVGPRTPRGPCSLLQVTHDPPTSKPWHFSCSHFFLSSHYHSRFWKATLTNYDSWLEKPRLFTPNSSKAQYNQTFFHCNFILFVCYGLLMSSADSWWMEHSRETMCLPKVIQSHCDYNNPEIIAMWCNAGYSPLFLLNGSLSQTLKERGYVNPLRLRQFNNFYHKAV